MFPFWLPFEFFQVMPIAIVSGVMMLFTLTTR
jgi:hypothetical protein